MAFPSKSQQVYPYLCCKGSPSLSLFLWAAWTSPLPFSSALAIQWSMQVNLAESFQSLSSFNFVWVLYFTTSPFPFLLSLSFELTNKEECMPTCKHADAAAESQWSCLHVLLACRQTAVWELGSIYQLWTRVKIWFIESSLVQGSAHFVWKARK